MSSVLNRLLFFACCIAVMGEVQAQENLLIPHRDKLRYDPSLSLGDVVAATVANFPRIRLAEAFRQEARAWKRRAGGLFAGPVMVGATYSGDQVGDNNGEWGIDTDLTFMLWKWGQKRTAGEVAGQAARYAEQYQKALALQVAGMVREALWDLKLKREDQETAREVLAVSARLTDVVRRRVEAGDLPHTDLLLAETDYLKRRTEVMTAEAEWMHARRRYLNLTRLERAPANFTETLSDLRTIVPEHPILAAATARVEELNARVHWSRFESDTGNQQIYFSIGSRHQQSERGGPTTNGIAANLTIPLGGGRYQTPNVAAEAVTLAEAETERGNLVRRLEHDHHEAEHLLQVDRIQLEAVEKQRQLTEENLGLARLAFAAGEMDLIDLLKLQVLAQQALREERQRKIRVELDIARYNQAVGRMP